MGSYNQERGRARPAAKGHRIVERSYTSREASRVSGVPFFTIDYWGRTRFLVPTIARGAGRGKGRQRLYSYGDVIRLRIARELREQKVSLQTLRTIVDKLAPFTDDLAASPFVVIGADVETATTSTELAAILKRRGRRVFGVVLDLRTLLGTVRAAALALDAAGRT